MKITKQLIINIFNTIDSLDSKVMNKLDKNINKDILLNKILNIIENTDAKDVHELKTKEDIKDFIIDKLELLKNNKNIVIIDRDTSQNLLKPFLEKNIFSGYTDLKSREEILKERIKSINKNKLEIEEIRETLSEAKEYEYNGYYVRDYKEYVIGFSANIYIDYLKKAEMKFIEEASKTNKEYEKQKMEAVLKKLKLYKLAHKLAYAILAEVSLQRKYKDLEIPKIRLIQLLGYNSSEKQIYQDIKEAVFSLRWLEFVVWDYSKISKKAKSRDYAYSRTIGSFITKITETDKVFIFDIEKQFVGCLQYIIQNDVENNKNKLNYFRFPLSLLLLTKNYSDSAYFLSQFLIREAGNSMLNTSEHKVISYKIDRYIKEANIRYTHNTKKVNLFIKSLKEIDFIEKTEPKLEEIELLKPKKILDTNLKIFIEKDVKILDTKIKNHLKLLN